jgi:hypothetical protein
MLVLESERSSTKQSCSEGLKASMECQVELLSAHMRLAVMNLSIDRLTEECCQSVDGGTALFN